MEKILIARTDRIGDFILSLPFAEALKYAYPNARVFWLVSPVVVPMLKFVEWCDGYFVYDKSEVKRPSGFKAMAERLRGERFEVSFALNPNIRLNMLLFLSGIPKRYGWSIKLGRALCTKTIPYTKGLGLMHEAYYNLEFLKLIGVQGHKRPNPRLHIATPRERGSNIRVAIHTGASCPSKRWPIERFKEVALRLKKNGVVSVFIGDKNESRLVKETMGDIIDGQMIIDNTGLPLDETTIAIYNSDMCLSNDSGPVHIAAAVDVPSVVIFGRNDENLSPARWKPLNPLSKVLHRADCDVCLAHRCRKGFECLKKISVDDVFDAVFEIIPMLNIRKLNFGAKESYEA